MKPSTSERRKMLLKLLKSQRQKRVFGSPRGQLYAMRSNRIEAAMGLALMEHPPSTLGSSLKKIEEMQKMINRMKKVMEVYVATRSRPDRNIRTCLAELFPGFIDYARLSLPQLKSILASRRIEGFNTKTRKAVLVQLLIDSERSYC
jgi:hypothetical protein